ncbi:MAG: hypothetical protein ACLFV5_00665 [Anaerolineales bacterium]
MEHLASFVKVLGVLVAVSLLLPRPAHAYLDPGTGSYILQLLIAILFGLGFAIKLFWKEIKGFFGNRFSGKGGHEKAQD